MAIYILGSTNACQLLKLPLLITHYIKHKAESPYMDFRSFVKMHYIDPQPLDDDYAQDMQLPFKTTPDTFLQNRPSIEPVVLLLSIKAPVIPLPQQLIVNDHIHPSPLVYSIFQPPKA